MDNLLAEGKCRPMIVVIPDTHALNPDILPIGVEHVRPYWAKNQETADEGLFQDIIPFVQERYHPQQQSSSHAIAGLSMGGLQAAGSGLVHPDYSSSIGAFSPAIWDHAQSDKVKDALASNAAQINRHIKLFQIVTDKSDNVVNAAPQQFADKLTQLA
jgi:enterochelin esterase-like enzyme